MDLQIGSVAEFIRPKKCILLFLEWVIFSQKCIHSATKLGFRVSGK